MPKWRDISGRAIAQAVSRQPAETQVQYQGSPCWVCDGQKGNGAGFYPMPHSHEQTYIRTQYQETLFRF